MPIKNTISKNGLKVGRPRKVDHAAVIEIKQRIPYIPADAVIDELDLNCRRERVWEIWAKAREDGILD